MDKKRLELLADVLRECYPDDVSYSLEIIDPKLGHCMLTDRYKLEIEVETNYSESLEKLIKSAFDEQLERLKDVTDFTGITEL